MEKYILLTTQCRSQYVGQYFGDKKMRKCGVCDNCLRQKNLHLSTEEFKVIADQILNQIGDNKVEIKLLLNHISGYKKEKVWKVLDFLQDEGKLIVSGIGFIQKA